MAEFTAVDISDMLADSKRVPRPAKYFAVFLLAATMAGNTPYGITAMGGKWWIFVTLYALLALYVPYVAWVALQPLKRLYPGMLPPKMLVGLCLIPIVGLLWALKMWFSLGRYITIAKDIVDKKKIPDYYNVKAMLIGIAVSVVLAAACVAGVEVFPLYANACQIAYVALAWFASCFAYERFSFFLPTYLLPFAFLADFGMNEHSGALPIIGFHCICLMIIRFADTVNGVVDAASAGRS